MSIHQTTQYWDSMNIQPAFAENNVAVTMASDDNYAIFLLVLLTSIRANASPNHNYDIIIVSDGISLKNRTPIINQIPAENISVRFVDGVKYLKNKDLRTDWHIKRATYLRFAVLEIFACYEKVLYLDCDLIVHRDIAELYHHDVSGKLLAAVRDSVMESWCCMEGLAGDEQRVYNRDILGVLDNSQYFNAGVLVMNLEEFRKHNHTTQTLLEMAAEKTLKWMDQDLLNMICYGNTTLLDIRWNVMVHDPDLPHEYPESCLPEKWHREYWEAVDDPYIVHFAGHVIPVFAPTVECGNLFWHYARMTSVYNKVKNKMYWEMIRRKIRSFPVDLGLVICPLGTKRRKYLRMILKILSSR